MRLLWLALFLTAFASLSAVAATTPTVRTYEYNARNQLTAINDSTNPERNVVFTYDENGNRQTKTQGGAVTAYLWDARGRLIEVKRDGTPVARYGYNAAGQRTHKELFGPNATLVRYVYDGPRLIEETNVLGNSLARYDYSADGRLLSMRRNGQVYQYLLDALGTPIAILRTDGQVVSRFKVDAWGNPIATVSTVKSPFGFTGYVVDDETGLHYANARYYDSELGAFLSEDPAAGDPMRPITLHPYVYANANPLIYLDRSGRTAELQQVLQGHEQNQQDIVNLAIEIKAMRSSATWYERPFVEIGMLGTVLLTAGNRAGEGVVTMANAGANVALTAADTYIADLGEGADSANQEVAEFAEAAFGAAEGAIADPRAAADAAIDAALDPYERAYYEDDTAAQLDLAASIDPRKLTGRVLNAMAPKRGPPTSFHVTEGANGRPELVPMQRMTGGGNPPGPPHDPVKLRRFLETDNAADARRHAQEAAEAGCCVTGTIDRTGAAKRRAARIKDYETKPGYDRDEFPPAVIRPDDPAKYSVQHVKSGDNRSSGSTLKYEIQDLPDGTRVQIVVPPKKDDP
ncbi:RHS repeat domain-containing protein [Tahibacter caeni]|uniref:RHS repeat domain-containing protein n=1 Tax=Tahibacter caeni TaxID=1453545 RepID=UPI002147BAE0|nr:RHS repeat-associated core domain-containing protein [Tahibacter caeni]